MTSRERVIRTLQFEKTDRAPYDLMEGSPWPELMDYFRDKHGLEDKEEILDFLDTDFRWTSVVNVGPTKSSPGIWSSPDQLQAHTKYVSNGPLADADTVADVESYKWPDPQWWQPGDFQAARRRWPDHALVFSAGWKPLFWSACEAFGMEGALIRILNAPEVFDAFIRRHHEFYMDILSRGLNAARGFCDICWLGDDFAGQKAMLVSPDLWRKHIKPYLAEQVQLARDHDMYVVLHSCGAVRPVLPDLIEIGVNALLVFQTTAAGMEPEPIAAEFGGRLAFYGGIDVQTLLSYGTPDEVKAEVCRNVRAFAHCGGYVVANSHHGVATIKPENIIAMCHAARA